MTRRGSVSQRRMNSLTDGQSTAQTFTTMRLMGNQQYLTVRRYQMKSITLFYEKIWKQQSKHWRWKRQLEWITYQKRISPSRRKSHDSICNKIWTTGKWPTTCTQSLVITLPKKGNLQLCQNYRTTSRISHPSKVMLRSSQTDSSH